MIVLIKVLVAIRIIVTIKWWLVDETTWKERKRSLKNNLVRWICLEKLLSLNKHGNVKKYYHK